MFHKPGVFIASGAVGLNSTRKRCQAWTKWYYRLYKDQIPASLEQYRSIFQVILASSFIGLTVNFEATRRDARAQESDLSTAAIILGAAAFFVSVMGITIVAGVASICQDLADDFQQLLDFAEAYAEAPGLDADAQILRTNITRKQTNIIESIGPKRRWVFYCFHCGLFAIAIALVCLTLSILFIVDTRLKSSNLGTADGWSIFVFTLGIASAAVAALCLAFLPRMFYLPKRPVENVFPNEPLVNPFSAQRE